MTVKKSTAIFFAALALLVLAVIYRFSAQPKNVSREKSDEVAVVVENINENIEKKKHQNGGGASNVTADNNTDAESDKDAVVTEKGEIPDKSEEETKPVVNFSKIVRKGAHVAEYAAFAVCFSLFFVLIDKINYTYLIVFATGLLYALFDEAHQFFIPGRTPKWRDILFDSIGLVIGTAMVYVAAVIVKAHNKRKKAAKDEV